MKIEKCQNRFEVIAAKLDPKEADELIRQFQDWVLDKQFTQPTDEDYMAALGPCGK